MADNDESEEESKRLIRLSGSGDRDSFAKLYDLYSDRLYSLAVKIVDRPELAGEILQDTFVSIWKSAPHYDSSKSGVFSWMVMILRRKAIDRMRYESNRIPGPVESPASEIKMQAEQNSPSSQALQREESSAIVNSLTDLPPDQREALNLAFFTGMTHSEVAEHLNVPIGTIKSRIRLGLNKLRNQLRNYER